MKGFYQILYLFTPPFATSVDIFIFYDLKKKTSFEILNYVQNEIQTIYIEASEPKWANPITNIIGVNSLRLGGLHMKIVTMNTKILKRIISNTLPKGVCYFLLKVCHWWHTIFIIHHSKEKLSNIDNTWYKVDHFWQTFSTHIASSKQHTHFKIVAFLFCCTFINSWTNSTFIFFFGILYIYIQMQAYEEEWVNSETIETIECSIECW